MPLKVLVAEDDPLTSLMIQRVLEKNSFEVTAVDNGADALQQGQNNKFDLVITDIIMPKIEGIELISKLVEVFPEIKIIAITSEGSAGHTRFTKLAETVGASASLQKPFSPEQLLNKISEIEIST